jgi:hypothetical protein
MRNWLIGWIVAAGICAAALPPASAQGPATQPRTADGRPDLSGVWQAFGTAGWDLLPHQARKGVPAGLGVVEGGEIPYQPWAAAKQKENFANRAEADPESKCFLLGVPRATYSGFPFRILQTPKQLAILYEYVHAVRRVYMDSPHPAGPIEWYMGDSRGRWEGDTLVVDVVHFTDQTWLDRSGNFHSDALHVVERYTPVTPGHIDYEVTIEDPKVFTRAWKMSMPLYRRLDTGRILEYECYALEFDFSAREIP